jgi:carboxypeptidase T
MKFKSILYPLILLSIALSLSTTSPLAAIPKSGSSLTHQTPILVQIHFDDIDQLNRLASRYDVWEVNHDLGYLIAYLQPAEILELGAAGFKIDIDQKRTSQLGQTKQLLPDQDSGIPGYPCYRTVEETYASLSQLADTHPNLAAWIDIGDSWEKFSTLGIGGYDLLTLVLTNKNIPGPKPVLYLMSAIHAREYATAELATRFAEYLVENYDQDPDVTWLLDYFAVHITPHVNPDGRKIAEDGGYWRKNTDNDDGCENSLLWGTDLNRNSSFKWGGIGASFDACEETFRGPSAGSEPETQAIQNYVTSIFPDQRGPADTDPTASDASGVFITLHSYGDLVLFPWGWSDLPSPNDSALETLGRKLGFHTGYQVCQSGENGCIYQTSGSSDDWAYGELGVASYTFELGTAFFESCSHFEQKILPDNIPAMLYAFKAARLPYQNPAGPESLNVSFTAQHIAPGAGLNLFATADDTRYDSAGQNEEPIQPIAAARYSLDAPSWVVGTQTYPLLPVDGSFDNPEESLSAIIDTSSLSLGRHTIFVESQDANSNWGVPSAVFLWITSEEYQPGIAPDLLDGHASANSTLVYDLQITNRGTQDDTYNIKVTGNSWPVYLSSSAIGPLNPEGSDNLIVTITIPEGVNVGDQDIAIVNAISQADPSKFAFTNITTTVRLPEIYLPTIAK